MGVAAVYPLIDPRLVGLFPDPRQAPEHGLVAVGGYYAPDFLLAAYSQGIFPWPSEDLPQAWFCPNPRAILPLSELHISRSLRRRLRQSTYEVRFDSAFEEVIAACAAMPRPGQDGTWITPELSLGFLSLHRAGYAHSAECYCDGELVGGIYGVSLGAMFCGESMFYLRPDASKVALVHLVQRLHELGFHFLDCQVLTPHMEHFGARNVARDEFLIALADALDKPTLRGSWAELEGSGAGVVC